MHELNNLNGKILAQLNNSTKKSPHRSDEFAISKGFRSYLEKKYGLEYAFRSGDKFLKVGFKFFLRVVVVLFIWFYLIKKDHDFEVKRFFNKTDYTTILIDSDQTSTFQFKLQNLRTKSYNINEKLDKLTVKGETVLLFKLTVDNKKLV